MSFWAWTGNQSMGQASTIERKRLHFGLLMLRSSNFAGLEYEPFRNSGKEVRRDGAQTYLAYVTAKLEVEAKLEDC